MQLRPQERRSAGCWKPELRCSASVASCWRSAGGAWADRENAQNQINRAESPEQLKSVIKTYKELMGGQLKGLKKQYEDTTGRKDFDTRLSDDTKTELGMGGAGAKADHSKMSDADLKKILGIP